MDGLDYGPVIITGGLYKNRAGLYDNDEYSEKHNAEHTLVYIGDFLTASNWVLIPFENLAPINSQFLLKRHNELKSIIFLHKENGKNISQNKRITYLEELLLLDSQLYQRMYEAMFTHKTDSIRVFLSHATEDIDFVKPLAVDLKHYGFDVWLDEWSIFAGESIPSKVADGVSRSDFLIVVLSEAAVESKWVESEWQSKYWDETRREEIMVIPIVKEKCAIPQLLKPKKHINFSAGYSQSLELLRECLVGLSKGKKSHQSDA